MTSFLSGYSTFITLLLLLEFWFDNSNSIEIKKEYNVIKLKDPYDEKELVKKIFYNKKNIKKKSMNL